MGRIVGGFLIFAGIGTLSLFTAATAAYLIQIGGLDALRARRISDHVVICGLGNVGVLFAQAFRREGYPVLAVEKAEENPHVIAARESGAAVIIGDAARVEVLERARLRYAKHIVIVAGEDANNVEIAAQARAIAREAGRSLSCSTQIQNPELWYALRSWDVGTRDGVRLEFFNVTELAARALLAKFSPFTPAQRENNVPPHVLIVGSGPLSQHLIRHMVRQWQDIEGETRPALPITLVDSSTAERPSRPAPPSSGAENTGTFHRTFHRPALHGVRARDVPLRRRGPLRHYARLRLSRGRGSRTVGRAAAAQPPSPLQCAGGGPHESRSRPRLTAAGRRAAGRDWRRAAQGLQPARTGIPPRVRPAWDQRIARPCACTRITWRRRPGIATRRRFHGMICPLELKESNRTQADHIATKLEAAGCHIVPLTALDTGPRFRSAAQEVEQLAEMEHERWLNERRRQGWTARRTRPGKEDEPQSCFLGTTR